MENNKCNIENCQREAKTTSKDLLVCYECLIELNPKTLVGFCQLCVEPLHKNQRVVFEDTTLGAEHNAHDVCVNSSRLLKFNNQVSMSFYGC